MPAVIDPPEGVDKQGGPVTLAVAPWELTDTPAGACPSPDALDVLPLRWRATSVPGTVAGTVWQAAGPTLDYDAYDWWYRTSFLAPVETARVWLRLDGLATVAQVWLNGGKILDACNMFVGHRIDITATLRPQNQLFIAFRALLPALQARRGRPRWRTALVDHQNLRWFRTTLLGRIPAWTAPLAPVGPWRAVAVELAQVVELTELNLQTRVAAGCPHLRLRCFATTTGNGQIRAARLRLGGEIHELAMEAADGGGIALAVDLTLPALPLWWPHTHGTPARVSCAVELEVAGTWVSRSLGRVGFKQLDVEQDGGSLRLRINDSDVFCRGACWTPLDVTSLQASRAQLRLALTQARDCGVNMLRVVGTMVYECDHFYELCDELGILVWQDFMFANMDYPLTDEAFRAEADAEVRFQLVRLQRYACIAAYCGGSEVAQQAAMVGLPASEWTNEFFSTTVAQHCRELHPATAYFPSTPWGGALPFHVGTGLSHYYGVGAYRRPLTDARTAKVRFTTECLGFSNVPDAQFIARMFPGRTPAPHDPRWKARVPRDAAAGWDFEDIRDHYLGLLFKVDPIALRSVDPIRYYALSRVVTGEVMQSVFSQWRDPASGCAGGLVWFLRDLQPGAGWGILDSTGGAKAACWYLKRAWAPQTVRLTDEGLDGLRIHVINDRAAPLEAELQLEMFQSGRVRTASARTAVHVPPRSSVTLQGDTLLGYFSDSTCAYGFGPPKHDVVAVRLVRPADRLLLGEDFYFPGGLGLPTQRPEGVSCEAQWTAEGKVAVTLRSDVFLQAVNVDSPDASADDNYFHVTPGHDKQLLFTLSDAASTSFKADFEALNLSVSLAVRLQRK